MATDPSTARKQPGYAVAVVALAHMLVAVVWAALLPTMSDALQSSCSGFCLTERDAWMSVGALLLRLGILSFIVGSLFAVLAVDRRSVSGSALTGLAASAVTVGIVALVVQSLF